MTKKLRLILTAVLLLCVVICGLLLLKMHLNYRKGEQFYTDAQNTFLSVDPATVTLPQAQTPASDGDAEDTGTDRPAGTAGGVLSEQGPTAVTDVLPEEPVPDLGIDFDALAAANPDIVGWLWIPNTDISYPLLLGDTNDSYIYTTYTGAYSDFGSIFLDYRNAGDFTDLNTIIYGHNMKNGSMFGSLARLYENAEAAAEHLDVYIFTREQTLHYQIFSSHICRFDAAAYTLDFSTAQKQTDYLNYVMARNNLAELSDALTAENRLVTLSTCSADKYDRFVAVGVLTEVFEVES